MLRIDIHYLSGSAYANQFPLDASTLFQAMVQKNAHCLEEARSALEALESSDWLRVDCARTAKTDVSVAVPRMPKVSQMRQYRLSEPSNKLITRQPAYRFQSRDGIHVSYFFDLDAKEEWLKYYEPFRLGHGESLCVAKASIIAAVPNRNGTMQVWEPSKSGRQMRTIRPGLLHDLILYHNARKSSTEVDQKVVMMSTTKQEDRHLMYRFYGRDGKPVSFPEFMLPQVAGMMRHAVNKNMRTAELKEYASNHATRQVKYLPLPTLGPYSDGRIRRAVIAEDAYGTMLPLHAVSELTLVDHDNNVVARAVRETESDWVFDQYLKPSTRKITVTPAVLDGWDTKHGKVNQNKHRKLIGRMLEGHEVISVTELPVHSPIRANSKYGQDKRAKVCLAVEFAEPVSLVVLGAGRNYGLGVFANQIEV